MRGLSGGRLRTFMVVPEGAQLPSWCSNQPGAQPGLQPTILVDVDDSLAIAFSTGWAEAAALLRPDGHVAFRAVRLPGNGRLSWEPLALYFQRLFLPPPN